MKMRVQLVIEDASGATTSADIASIERRTDDLIGLSFDEAKAMTGTVQRFMVEAQAREAIVQNSTCPECQSRLCRNDTHRIPSRTQEFHPRALTDPYETVSRHTARATH